MGNDDDVAMPSIDFAGRSSDPCLSVFAEVPGLLPKVIGNLVSTSSCVVASDSAAPRLPG